jgi:hypothetical protein
MQINELTGFLLLDLCRYVAAQLVQIGVGLAHLGLLEGSFWKDKDWGQCGSRGALFPSIAK